MTILLSSIVNSKHISELRDKEGRFVLIILICMFPQLVNDQQIFERITTKSKGILARCQSFLGQDTESQIAPNAVRVCVNG